MHQFFLKMIPVFQRCVLELCTVVIDGIDGVTEDAGNLGRLRNAEADQGEDAQFRRQLSAAGRDAGVRTEQGVELLDKPWDTT